MHDECSGRKLRVAINEELALPISINYALSIKHSIIQSYYIYIYIYAIMKTMFPPGYHHNGFVTTHAL